jgi:predicted metal-dependent enzyme (double-stranded beta helix superfamily)
MKEDTTDAVIAALNSHKIILENNTVRVVEVIIPPGQKEPMHTHAWPSVMIVDSSTKIKYYTESNGGVEYPEREASREKPFIEYMEPEVLHAVENLDEIKTYHALRIELKNNTLK